MYETSQAKSEAYKEVGEWICPVIDRMLLAFHEYEMDVEEEPPFKHKQMLADAMQIVAQLKSGNPVKE